MFLCQIYNTITTVKQKTDDKGGDIPTAIMGMSLRWLHNNMTFIDGPNAYIYLSKVK